MKDENFLNLPFERYNFDVVLHIERPEIQINNNNNNNKEKKKKTKSNLSNEMKVNPSNWSNDFVYILEHKIHAAKN